MHRDVVAYGQKFATLMTKLVQQIRSDDTLHLTTLVAVRLLAGTKDNASFWRHSNGSLAELIRDRKCGANALFASPKMGDRKSLLHNYALVGADAALHLFA